MMTIETSKTVAQYYLAELRNPSTVLSAESITQYAQQAVALFFDYFRTDGKPLREAIEILCEINSLPDVRLSRIGLEALFPELVEKLNDSFEPSYCDLYDRLFAQVISFCRQLPEGRELDTVLNQFGLSDEASILNRKTSLTKSPKFLSSSRSLKKILFLSRVTIGADVAITSVLISGLKQLYPQAEIVLLGPAKLSELYGGDAHIRILPIDYGRSANLLARLNNWINLVNILNDEVANHSFQEISLFDPDSRFTQLGLLPLFSSQTEAHSYFYFESRSFSRSGLEKLGQLSIQWLNEVCGTKLAASPFVSLPPSLSNLGGEVTNFLRLQNHRQVICLSFGVGGNSTKRISDEFEMKLMEQLSVDNQLILDSGVTNEDYQHAARILDFLLTKGKSVLWLNEKTYHSDLSLNQYPVEVIAWRGGIGSFAALIDASDQYIGYDSSGQHIAAALATPSLTLFVNSGSPSFAKRWHPFGTGKIQILEVPHNQNPWNESFLNQLLQRVSLIIS